MRARVAHRTPTANREIVLERDRLPSLIAAGRYGDARRAIDAALKDQPDAVAVLISKARLLRNWGRLLEARSECDSAARQGATDPDFLCDFASICLGLGDLDGALRGFERSVAANPVDRQSRIGLARTLQARNDYEGALGALCRALEISPEDRDALMASGACQLAQGKYAEAEAVLRRAIERDPQNAAAHTNLGLALIRQDRHEEAIECYESAARLETAYGQEADGWLNLAIALADAGRLDEALRMFESSLAERPGAMAHFNYALALLRFGRLTEGWRHYEFRWQMQPSLSRRLRVSAPVWSGQDLTNKTLLLRVEQGFGDTIQFLRYAPKLKALGATVIVRVQAGLEELARGFAGIDHVLAQGEESPIFDFYAHTLSLPRVFGTDLDSVPAEIPYLHVDSPRAAAWLRRIPHDNRPRVGIIWGGDPGHLKDRYRSTLLASWRPVLGVPDIRFFSLQKGPRTSELAAMREEDIVDLDSALENFADAAAAIDELDLLICVDTAPAHIAGALGKPVWVLLPTPCDWRWLDGRDNSPWYPSMRLFRQTRRGEWSDVFSRVAAALREFVRDRANPRPNIAALANHGVGSAPRAPLPWPPPTDTPRFSAVAETRVGILQYLPDDDPLGQSIRWYGEHLQPQIAWLTRLVKDGATVVEVAAGVGAHALALAQSVGATGHLLLYEDRPLHRRILQQNVAANGARRATVMQRRLGGPHDVPVADVVPAEKVTIDTLDDLGLKRLDWLKINDGARAQSILAGGNETLWKLRPSVFVAAQDASHANGLADVAGQYGYRCWRMETPLFNPDNFNRRTENVFGNRCALSLIAIGEEIEFDMKAAGCVEITR